MIRPPPCFLFLLFCGACAAAQTKPPNLTPNNQENNVQVSFRPSIAVVVGIFSIMLSFTFLLLMYAKFCHRDAAGNFGESIPNNLAVDGSPGDEGRSSGIDKVLIESLPFFRFSALKGSREGLECAVCLARFEDNDILRLLPRCKHAFHMNCIDRWLHSHSSCPLCRTRVAADDLAYFKYSASSRFFLRDPSGRSSVPDAIETGDAALELFVERKHVGSSSMRFTASFRSAERSKDRGSLLPSGGNDVQASAPASNLHTLKHRIIVSDVVFQGRWSDFNSADLISLDSEMLRLTASRMESEPAAPRGNAAALDGEWVPRIREEMERKRRSENRGNHSITRPRAVISSEYSAMDMTSLISSASRSMSDITAVTRHRSPPVSNHGEKEKRAKQMWLPIARRTVERFAGKERGSMLQPRNTGDGVEKV